MPTARAVLDSATSEAAFQESVLGLARLCGWTTYHTHDSRRSQRGWPDIVLIRPPRLIVRELKRESASPTEEQAWWLDALRACGVDAGVWHPSDWERIVEALR